MTAKQDPREYVKRWIEEHESSERALSLKCGQSPNWINNWMIRPGREKLDPGPAITLAEVVGVEPTIFLWWLDMGPEPTEPNPIRRAVRAIYGTPLPPDVQAALVALVRAYDDRDAQLKAQWERQVARVLEAAEGQAILGPPEGEDVETATVAERVKLIVGYIRGELLG